MKALITGASSGIGKDMAKILSNMGFDLVIVARNKEKLDKLKSCLKTNVRVISLDLSKVDHCFQLYEQTKNDDIGILINNAGFGDFGSFDKTDIQTDLNMIDLNIKSVHILTKLFLKDFKIKNRGYILNVASSAGFLPGPLMSTYYASKNYILRLTEAVYEELRRSKSSISISVLCPGPVETNFNNRASVHFSLKGLNSFKVARYAIKQMFDHKLIIIPGNNLKVLLFSRKFLPEKSLLKVCYHMQSKKSN